MVASAETFFDTSILLGGLIDLGAPSVSAQRILGAIEAGRVGCPHTAWHCCLEFYAVSTRLPEELRLSPRDAWQLIHEEILGRFAVHQLPDDRRRGFFQTAVEERVVGGRIYDAHIAETASQAGVKVVVTDNVRHFTALARHGIPVMSGAEFVKELGDARPKR